MHIRGEMTSGRLTLSGFVRSRLESLWWFEVDFWPRSVHFRRGPPTIFRKHMPSGMGTESLGVIGCIFAENGPLEGGIEASFWGTGWGAKGDFRRIFGPDPFIFEGGPPPFFRKHLPSGMGTESLRVIGCIFAENGPLEGGIESSFWGTGWGAKGDFMRYLTYTRTFSNREPIPFSKAHALSYTHSKVGNDQMHIRGEMTSGRLTLSGFVRSRLESLWWFEVDFWPRSVHFRRGPPTIFRKHMPSGMGTESLGVIGCIFAENGPLEGGIEASFWGTGWGAKGDFRRIFGPDPFISKGAPHHFRKHLPSGMGTESLRVIGCIFAENGPLEGGIESSFWGTGWVLRWFHALFLPIPVHFRIENPYLFRKHMPWAIRTAKLGMIRCIFVEKWPLEG